MKKNLWLGALIVVAFSAICFATGTGTPSTYKTPILKNELNFQAAYANGKVSMSWANISVVTSNAMKWYKVTKSATNPTPVYPEDGYITAISDRNQTSFIENNPTNGSYYYRVCAIMEDMNRYCSNVVRLTIQGTTSTTTTTTTSIIALTDSLKATINGMVQSVMTTLQLRYGNNLSSKITVLDALITKITSLQIGKYKLLFQYLGEKLEEENAILKIQNALQI